MTWEGHLRVGAGLHGYKTWPKSLKCLLSIMHLFFSSVAHVWVLGAKTTGPIGKTKLFHNRPSSFCSRYPNVCDRIKKMDYRCSLMWIKYLHCTHGSLFPNTICQASHPANATTSSYHRHRHWSLIHWSLITDNRSPLPWLVGYILLFYISLGKIIIR
jgi:hypothetical protein